jgi:S-adenosylhomocysteine hydrolase
LLALGFATFFHFLWSQQTSFFRKKCVDSVTHHYERTIMAATQRQPTRYDLNGLVAVVTGGGQNIGKEIARAMVRSGASVVVVDWNPATATAAADELQVCACSDNICVHLCVL